MDFVFVFIMLIMLLMGIMQVAVYLHVRNVLAASAASGARHAASLGASDASAAAEAQRLVAAGLGAGVADSMRCTAGAATGSAGEEQVVLRCSAHVPVLFGLLGNMPGPTVTAHSIKEG